MGTTDEAPQTVSIPDAIRLLQERQMGSPPANAVPEPFQADGIGPGSAQRMGNYICTAAFLFRGADGTYYVSTAGHCLLKPGVTAATPVSGYTDPALVHPTISLCVVDCVMNVPSVGTYVAFTANPAQGYHPVAFAMANGVGNDFGLIQVPNDALPLLRPWLPQFGGPTGVVNGIAPEGDFLAIYGHGAECCEGVGAVLTKTPADQGRVGMSLGPDGDGMWYVMTTEGGDSGAPIVTAEVNPDALVRGLAAQAINTHGPLGTGYALGTPISRALDLVGLAGLDIALVNHDDTIEEGEVETFHPEVALLSPADGAILEPGALDVSGTVDRLVPDGAGAAAAGSPDAGRRFAVPNDWIVPGAPFAPYGDVEELEISDEEGVLHVSMYLAGLLDGITPGAAGNPVSYSVDFIAKNNVAAGLTYRLSLQTNLDETGLPDNLQRNDVGLFVLSATANGLQSVCPVDGAVLPTSGIDGDFYAHWYVPLEMFNHDNLAPQGNCAAFARAGRGLEGDDILSGIVGSADLQVAIVNFGAVDEVTHPDYTIQGGGSDPLLEHVLVELLSGETVVAAASALVDTSDGPFDSWALDAPLDLSAVAVGEYVLRATWRNAGTGATVATDAIAITLDVGEQVEPCDDGNPGSNDACVPTGNVAPVVESLLRLGPADKLVNDVEHVLSFNGVVTDSGGCNDLVLGELTATVSLGGAIVEALEGFDLATGECVEGQDALEVTFGVTFDAGIVPGTYTVALHALDQHGAAADDGPSVDVVVRTPPVVTIGYTGGLGHLQFPEVVPGGTNVLSMNLFTVTHDYETAMDLDFDLQTFTGTVGGEIPTIGKVTLLVDGNLLAYSGPTVRLTGIDPGQVVDVQIRIDELPAVLPAGNYHSTFGLMPVVA